MVDQMAQRMRFRRQCYDKPHRCSGWAGGGFRYPRKGSFNSCPNGYMPYPDTIWKKLSFATCDQKCGTIGLPWASRWLDYSWWRWVVLRDLIWEYEDWRKLRKWERGEE